MTANVYTKVKWVADWIKEAQATDTDALRDAALAAGEKAYTASVVRECMFGCGATMVQEGVFSTGLPLDHYAPSVDELLKNKYALCLGGCGDQGS